MANDKSHAMGPGTLPAGVTSLEQKEGTMVVGFADGTRATVTRSFLAAMGDPTFELWLPREADKAQSEMIPKLSEQEVFDHLERLASAIAERSTKG